MLGSIEHVGAQEVQDSAHQKTHMMWSSMVLQMHNHAHLHVLLAAQMVATHPQCVVQQMHHAMRHDVAEQAL
jgi:hypothetical protein